MPKLINLTGQKFGRLTALYKLNNYHKDRVHWLCICDCDNLVEVSRNNLQSSTTKSCGCYNKERIKETNSTHGKSHSRLYDIYYKMRSRCYNKNDKCYKDYGARGITICDDWLCSYATFYKWSIENRYREGLTIDRIDNNKGYSPNNCRWVTMKTQCRNTRHNKCYTINGETHCLKEWCEILNLKYNTVYHRLYKLGWPIEKALEVR